MSLCLNMILTALLSFVFTVAHTQAQLIGAMPEPINAPNFQNGEFWRFKVTTRNRSQLGELAWMAMSDGTYILRYLENRIQTFDLVDVDERRTNSRGRLIALLGLGQGANFRVLQFPLTVGQNVHFTTKTANDRPRNVNIDVVGTEQISVSAGIFQSYKIVKHVNWTQSNPKWGVRVYNVPSTYFYSPECKSIVKSVLPIEGAIQTIELITFGRS